MSTQINTEKREKILNRIREALNRTTATGATEGEMEIALKMAQRLMMQYNIDQDEVLISASDINILEIENEYEGHETKYWLWNLLQAIGRSYSCQVLKQNRFRLIKNKYNRDSYQKYEIYKLIGVKEDRLLVKQIFDSILPVIRNLRVIRWKEYYQQNKNSRHAMNAATFAKSYFSGFVYGIEEKLTADREEFLAANADRSKWGLIVVKKDDLIEAFIQEELKPTQSKVRGVPVNEEAFNLGLEDGKEKNGNKQLMANNNL